MKLFALDRDVTPVLLLSNIAGRRWGDYVIDGGVGFLHRAFERQWREAWTGSGNDDGPTAILDLANFRELSELAYIDPHQPVETQVYPWCEVVAAVLRSLPMTHAELKDAYKEERLLAGTPLTHFLLSQKEDKRTAFQQFLSDG